MSARCTHWIGAEHRYCGARDGVRQYLNSVVCPLHTPSALRGLPEPETGRGLPTPAGLPAAVRATPADRRPLTAVPDQTT
jgi:nitrite reductase/ring-hydroxylating ferredoxin subunit